MKQAKIEDEMYRSSLIDLNMTGHILRKTGVHAPTNET